MSPKQKKDSKKDVAILALLSGNSLRAAAEKAQISERTLLRWKKDPAFRERLEQGRQQAFDQSVNRLTQASVHAVECLVSIMRDAGTPPGVRVRAALGILDSAISLRDISLTERIDQIEELLKTELETPIVQ